MWTCSNILRRVGGVLVGLAWAGATALALAVGAANPAPLAPEPGELAYATPGQQWWLRQGQWQASAQPWHTVQGSTWKLWVYWYLRDQKINPPDYSCTGADPEEVFCCTAGQSVDMDSALAQSCGLYFSPQRLGITPQAWQRYWRRQPVPHWLTQWSALRPDTVVPVQDVLALLQQQPEALRQQTQVALSTVTLNGRAEDAFPLFGSTLRLKTWTWDHPRRAHEKIGGVLGWLSDGQPVWAAAYGPSSQLFARWGQPLQARWQRSQVQAMGQSCVDTQLFARYPIARVVALDADPNPSNAKPLPLQPGVLRGRYLVHFTRHTQAQVHSQGEVSLLRTPAGWQLWAHLPLEEYIARVVEREASSTPEAAARALAIVARTYLLQNAEHAGGCYRLRDSSSTQRVLPQPARAASLAVAWWSHGLVLSQDQVHFHLNQSGPGRLAWTQAQARAALGWSVAQILREVYPNSQLVSLFRPVSRACVPWPAWQAWLLAQQKTWRRQLQSEPGFEMPQAWQLCRSDGAHPSSNTATGRIDLPPQNAENLSLSLAHEWLHLAFKAHPQGQNEMFIENWARRLVQTSFSSPGPVPSSSARDSAHAH